MALRLKANRRFPSIPVVVDDPANHTQVLMAVKEALDIGQRRTSDLLNSFIRVEDLIDLGLITIEGNTNSIVGTDLSEIANIGDLSGSALGDFLRFDGSDWVNDQLALSDITQAMVTQHQAALSISWSQLTGAPPSLDDLFDVDAPAPTDGDVLTWNDASSEWIAAPALDQGIDPTWTGEHIFTMPTTFIDDVLISGDDLELQIGEESDLRLFHDGTNSIVRNDTGSLLLLDGATQVAQIENDRLSVGISEATIASITGMDTGLQSLNVGARAAFMRAAAEPGIDMYRVNTSFASPSALVSNATIFELNGYAYYTSGGPGFNRGFRLAARTLETQTSSAGGTRMLLRLFPVGSVTETDALDVRTSALWLPQDNQQLQIGAGNDLRLYHDGTASWLRNTTGQLFISPAGNTSTPVNLDGTVALNVTSERLSFLATGAANLDFARFKGSYTAPASIASGDTLGSFRYRAHDGGSNLRTVARMTAQASETWTAGSAHGTRLDLANTANGATAAVVRLALINDQIRITDGTIAAPGLSFINDDDTGVVRSAENEVSVVTAGVQRAVFTSTGVIAIQDGITAPGSNITGMAQLYIDSADGDLKIRFADGTVKTIVTDT
jgi:hypothetical protein